MLFYFFIHLFLLLLISFWDLLKKILVLFSLLLLDWFDVWWFYVLYLFFLCLFFMFHFILLLFILLSHRLLLFFVFLGLWTFLDNIRYYAKYELLILTRDRASYILLFNFFFLSWFFHNFFMFLFFNLFNILSLNFFRFMGHLWMYIRFNHRLLFFFLMNLFLFLTF